MGPYKDEGGGGKAGGGCSCHICRTATKKINTGNGEKGLTAL